jgi:hypothetical protein
MLTSLIPAAADVAVTTCEPGSHALVGACVLPLKLCLPHFLDVLWTLCLGICTSGMLPRRLWSFTKMLGGSRLHRSSETLGGALW